MILQTCRHPFRIRNRDQRHPSAVADAQMLHTHCFGAKQSERFGVKQAVVDVGAVDAGCNQIRRAAVRVGRDVGIAETARVAADGGIEQFRHARGHVRAVLLFQTADHVKDDLARCRRPRVGVEIGKRRSGSVMVDHEIGLRFKTFTQSAELGGGGNVRRDDPHIGKVGWNPGVQNAFLRRGGEETQAFGNLALAHAPRATAERSQQFAQGECRPNRVAVGIAVEEQECVPPFGQPFAERLKDDGGEASVSHRSARPRSVLLRPKCPACSESTKCALRR